MASRITLMVEIRYPIVLNMPLQRNCHMAVPMLERVPSIAHQHGTRDGGRSVAQEKDDLVGDLVRLGKAAERRCHSRHCSERRAFTLPRRKLDEERHILPYRRLDAARCDGVDADPPWCALPSRDPRELDRASL